MLDKFVIEPSNGLWGLSTNNGEQELRERLLNGEKQEKCYKGTQILVLNTTNACNLNCIYCSAKHVRSREKMSFDIAKASLDRAVELENVPDIVFHGSEPLKNMPLIRETVNYGEELARVTEKNISFYIQTNLTLMDDEIAEFMKAHRIAISTSFDGLPDSQNKNRPYLDGSPTYKDVREKIEKVLKFQKGICAICVITKNNVHDLTNIVQHFEDIGITDVQLLPSVRCSNGYGHDSRPSNEDLSKQYLRVFEEVINKTADGSQKINVRNICQYLRTFFSESSIDSCRICSSTTHHPLLAVDNDGNVYPCDFFWGDKTKVLGNVRTDSFVSMFNHANNPRMCSIEKSGCRDCDWRNICGGGCMADRLFSGEKPYYCDTHKAVYNYLSQKMPHLIEEGLLKKLLGDK